MEGPWEEDETGQTRPREGGVSTRTGLAAATTGAAGRFSPGGGCGALSALQRTAQHYS